MKLSLSAHFKVAQPYSDTLVATRSPRETLHTKMSKTISNKSLLCAASIRWDPSGYSEPGVIIDSRGLMIPARYSTFAW